MKKSILYSLVALLVVATTAISFAQPGVQMSVQEVDENSYRCSIDIQKNGRNIQTDISLNAESKELATKDCEHIVLQILSSISD
jgi:hypothetical protein